MINADTIKLGFNQRDKVYFGKFKDPKKGWKTKFVPRAFSTTETEAQGWFADFLNGLAGNKTSPATNAVKGIPTLTTVFPLWDEYISKVRTNKSGNKLDDATISCWHGKISKYVLKHPIASVPLTVEEFTPHVVLGWVEHIKSLGMAKYTTKHIVGVLGIMVGDGRKKGWINLPYNPVSDEIVKDEIPTGETVAGKNNPIHLSAEEARKVIAGSHTKIPVWRKTKNIVALTTGARDGELQGLAWKHIDLQERTMVIDRQLYKGGINPIFKDPKRQSFRTVPLHHLAVQALTFWKSVSAHTSPEDPVFGNPIAGSHGQYARTDSAEYLRQDLRAIGLSDLYQGKFSFDFHATRRTFLTLLSDAGVHPEKAEAIVGHAQAGIRRHYVKAHVEEFIAIIEKLPFKGIKLDWCKK